MQGRVKHSMAVFALLKAWHGARCSLHLPSPFCLAGGQRGLGLRTSTAFAVMMRVCRFSLACHRTRGPLSRPYTQLGTNSRLPAMRSGLGSGNRCSLKFRLLEITMPFALAWLASGPYGSFEIHGKEEMRTLMPSHPTMGRGCPARSRAACAYSL